MSAHLTDDDLQLYVMGALQAPRLDAVEAHVTACDSCAERLEREASLEVSLGQVARSDAKARSVRPRVQLIAGALVLAILTAAVVWLVS